MKISVLITNWNTLGHLKNSLASLKNQTYSNFEIIVADNGSTDGSVEYVRSNFPQVKIVPFKENVGYSAAINSAARASEGEWLLFFDSDAEATPDLLKEFSIAVHENPSYSCFSCKILSGNDKKIIDSIGNELCISGVSYRIGHNQKDSDKFNSKIEVFGGSTVVLYNKEAFFDIGGLDEEFFVFYEDVEVNLRAQLYGYKYLYIPKAVAYHYGHGSVKNFRPFVSYLTFRNMLFTLVKSMPSRVLLNHFRTMVWRYVWWGSKDLIKFITRIKYNEEVKIRLRAYGYVVLNMFSIFEKRKETLRKKRVTDQYIENILRIDC